MFNDFIYNGKSLIEFGGVITDYPVISIAQRDLTYEDIPGKDEQIILDNGKFKNTSLKFNISLVPLLYKFDVQETVYQIKKWLKMGSYQKLETPYEPYGYRLAYIKSISDFTYKTNDVVSFKVEFSCKPYLFLYEGQRVITQTSKSFIIKNPTEITSKPYMKIYGNGDITIKVINKSCKVEKVVDFVEIDSEIMDCYKNNSNLNVNFSGNFPEFVSGENQITVTGEISQIDIIARWCIL